MKRAIQVLAMLMTIMLAVLLMIGCSEEEKLSIANVTKVIPEDGSEIVNNAEITIIFDNPVTDVIVYGVPAAGSGTEWKWKDNLPPGKHILNITWINEDGSEGEEKKVTYTVKPLDGVTSATM